MDRYHTNKLPAGDPVVMPGPAAVPSPRPAVMANASQLAAAQATAKQKADAYFGLATPSPVDPPPPTPPPTPQTGTRLSKLNELAAALNDIPNQVEAAADQALTRLTAARDKAHNGIGKINDIAGQIEQTATTIDNFTNQLSNGGPPL